MNSKTARLVAIGAIVWLASFASQARGLSMQARTTGVDVASAQQNEPTIIIPFTLTEFNNLLVKATINETDAVDLMFHTAVGSVSLTREATARLTSITWDESGTVTSWGGETSARGSSDNALQIGELCWENISLTEDEHSGKLSDGKFGPNLFENKIVEIDFDKQQLLLHPSLPPVGDEYEKLAIVIKGSSLFLKGQMKIGENTCEQVFLIHSGFGGTILLDDEFVSANGLADKLETISESELKDAYGNVLKTKKVSLPSIGFGRAVFTDVPAGLFEGSIGRQKMSVLGGDILKRFNVIIDLNNESIYLKPNDLFETAFAK